MSIKIPDCLKRKRDICIKDIITSQNTAFRWTPALVHATLVIGKLDKRVEGQQRWAAG